MSVAFGPGGVLEGQDRHGRESSVGSFVKQDWEEGGVGVHRVGRTLSEGKRGRCVGAEVKVEWDY